jgi:hypothetical protein
MGGDQALTPRSIDEFTAARRHLPRGQRPAAMRAAADVFRARFKSQGLIGAARTVDLFASPVPTAFALQGAAKHLNPYVTVVTRLVVVQFDGYDGTQLTLAWEPELGPPRTARAPLSARLMDRYGGWIARRLASVRHHTITTALASIGLTPADVDLVSFANLRGQDLRWHLGTEELEPLFPNADFVLQRREVDAVKTPHPAQAAVYDPAGMDGVRDGRIVLVDGDVELGQGVALLLAPGRTHGNHSLCLNTTDGVWIVSDNGVAADSWQPHLSRVAGVREFAEGRERQVILNADALEDSLDQYDAMLMEKAVADAQRDDPRWANVLPSRELVRRRLSWPVEPTYVVGGIAYGAVRAG